MPLQASFIPSDQANQAIYFTSHLSDRFFERTHSLGPPAKDIPRNLVCSTPLQRSLKLSCFTWYKMEQASSSWFFCTELSLVKRSQQSCLLKSAGYLRAHCEGDRNRRFVNTLTASHDVHISHDLVIDPGSCHLMLRSWQCVPKYWRTDLQQDQVRGAETSHQSPIHTSPSSRTFVLKLPESPQVLCHASKLP